MIKVLTGSNRILGLFLLTFVFHLTMSWLFPVTQDEAYYFYWSRFLDWGYFDHPPIIAWLASIGPNVGLGHSVLSFRLGGLISASLLFFVNLSLFQKLGFRDQRSLFSALVLVHLSLVGLLFGFINTPDLPLALFWSLALHEGIVAISGRPHRWLSAGVFTGLGIQSKYTMVLIGLVFLYGLVRTPKALKSPWPYLGGFMCVLVLTPHLLWNANHDWVSFRFQLGRGFLSDYNVEAQFAAQLPKPQIAKQGSRSYQLANYFTEPKKKPKPSRQISAFEKSVNRVFSFLGGQLAVWGLLAPLLGWQIYLSRFRKKNHELHFQTPAFHLIVGATLVPLVIFGLISPFQHIEANWSAFYVISAAAWVILSHPRISPKFIWWGGFANIFVTLVILLHSYYPLTTKQVNKDRILRETHGYQELTKFLSRISEPVFADTYQNVSMLSFYDPHGSYAQWPGIARISEAMRRQEMVPYQLDDLIAKRGFYLLTDNFIPPEIPGFYAAELWQILDCLNQPIEVQKASLVGRSKPSCSPYVHRWTFVYYRISETAIHFPKIELPELGNK